MQARMARPPSVAQPPNKPHLSIGVPCYGGMMSMPTANSLINLCVSLHGSGIQYKKDFLGNESLVTRARNRIANRFLLEDTDCTHLLFVDADVGFRPQDVAAMVRGDFDVCVGAYPMKTIAWEAIVRAVKDGHPPEHLAELTALYAVNAHTKDTNSGEVDIIEKNGAMFLEVLEGGTGFMLIKRAALQAYVETYREEIKYLADYSEDSGKTHYMIFQADRDPLALKQGEMPRYLSEDYHFCRRWAEIGGKIHMCLDAKLSHTGTYTWLGDVSKLFVLGPKQETNGVEVVGNREPEIEMVTPEQAAS